MISQVAVSEVRPHLALPAHSRLPGNWLASPKRELSFVDLVGLMDRVCARLVLDAAGGTTERSDAPRKKATFSTS